MTLPERFRGFIFQHRLFQPGNRLLLAVSGGLDSVVLAELCRESRFSFGIAHCNFQLRGDESERDEQFVRQLADKYGVDFYATRFDTKEYAAEKKTSIQEAARELRYAWFEKIRKENSYTYIVTAHHADDNIETVTMNFFRGTGVKGLRGIEPVHAHIVRPLLFARRAELELYQQQRGLVFVTDSSNLKDDYSRNFFRHQVIPLVEKIYPGTQENLLANIGRFRDVERLYADAVKLHKKKLLVYKGNEVHIPVKKLEQLPAMQSLVYEIIHDFNFSAAQTSEAIALLKSETGKYISSSSHRIIRNRQWLIIAPLKAEEADLIVIESPGNFPSAIGLVNISTRNNNRVVISPEKHIASLDADHIQFPLLMRKWKQGDYFYPMGMPKKKKLARFFIDQKLSKTEKEQVWVIEMQKKIIWVVGHRIDDRFKVTARTNNILEIKILNGQTG
jgi:tRNA(Ile)-lysidine synthase